MGYIRETTRVPAEEVLTQQPSMMDHHWVWKIKKCRPQTAN